VSDKQGTHFYLIAIQYAIERGWAVTGSKGTWTPGRKQSRLDVFNEIWQRTVEKHPEVAEGVVLAFDLQPNKL
jgi:hypothetical protein